MRTKSQIQPQRPVKKTAKGWILLLVAGSLGLCGVCGLSTAIYSYGEFAKSAKIVEGLAVLPAPEVLYALSADQQALVEARGYPDSFTITFYREEFTPDFQGEVREEIWRYFDEELSFNFYNGEKTFEEAIPPVSPGWIPAQYRPDQFAAYAGLKETLASAGIRDYFELPLEDELVRGGRLYFAPGLTFGLTGDRLIYVETISMAEEGGQNE